MQWLQWLIVSVWECPNDPWIRWIMVPSIVCDGDRFGSPALNRSPFHKRWSTALDGVKPILCLRVVFIAKRVSGGVKLVWKSDWTTFSIVPCWSVHGFDPNLTGFPVYFFKLAPNFVIMTYQFCFRAISPINWPTEVSWQIGRTFSQVQWSWQFQPKLD